MKSAQNDMTVGNPMKIIFGFTLPIFIGNVFQQFYNMADAVIVGKFVGNKALAAVGSTGTIMFLIYGFVVGMTAGFSSTEISALSSCASAVSASPSENSISRIRASNS